MKIALFPDDYLPNSTLVHAKMFHELALELKRLGHEPLVITPSHGTQTELLKHEVLDGIEVWRFRSPVMRGRSKVRRLITETLLSYNAYRALNNVSELSNIDACINYSPTIFFGPLMRWFKNKHGSFIYLILRDIFPQWVIDEGIISSKSPLALYFRLFESLNYRVSDCIGLMSEANIKYFSSLHPNIENLRVLRNWANITPHSLSSDFRNVRTEFALHDKVIFFYGGNIGHAQDMMNLVRLAQRMKYRNDAHFLFVGQGDEFDLVHSMQENYDLDNITLLSSVTQEVYKDFLCQVDVGLFSLAKTHKAHNFPGKLLGYMAQSLPILGSVNKGNDLVDFINYGNAGKAYINGDDDSLFNMALKLLDEPDLRGKFGAGAYQVLQKYFSVNSAAKHLIDTIRKD